MIYELRRVMLNFEVHLEETLNILPPECVAWK